MAASAFPSDLGGGEPLIVVRDLRRTYAVGPDRVAALAGVSVTVERGAFIAVMGPSGSGKSTFMNVLGCLDRPDGGEYRLDGEDVGHADPDSLAAVRNRKIGFVFQSFHLLPRLTARANVELPMVYGGIPRAERVRRAAAALEAVGLGDRWHHRPAQLSGGQQQRVAIARALVNRPLLLLADEPTGALDSRTTREIMELLRDLNRGGLTIVLVTHEAEVAAYAGRVLTFRDGRLAGDAPPADAAGAAVPG
ncbi:ABC transporter ATP-binding protein [Azospirillum halopraeferens]|uniref:ABC transporter ATP-binding protein n=1 Tax=Azospirillum halopraeferens TaxID=34010 RepID=UPI001FDED0CE|nr:ABC transporter ATP-binding protein [Azospirillum halopraeferens]